MRIPFIYGIPKAELHIHIEGALGPELMLELAAQNGIDLPYSSVDDMRRAYDFKDLQKYARFFRSGGGNIFLIILLWPNISFNCNDQYPY
jgi:hypothetical protein